ncbi:MAG: hypothetical protein ACRC5C_14135, partial [Bacilli bacterium]
MKQFRALLHTEVNRLLFPMSVILILMGVLQTLGVLIDIDGVNYAIQNIAQNGLSQSVYAPPPAEVYKSTWTVLALFGTVFGIVAILIVSAVVWYQDWVGKSKYIYRLLLNPIPRWQIYVAKLLTVVLFVCLSMTTQIVFLPVQQVIANALITSGYFAVTFYDLVSTHPVLWMLDTFYIREL